MLWVSWYTSHQPKAGEGILTFVLHMIMSFINEDKTVSMGKKKFHEYGPSETQGWNTNVKTSELKWSQ